MEKIEIENDTTFKNLIAMLEANKIEFKQEEHEPVLTSQEAADVRGVSMDSGAKAIFLKDKISKKKYESEEMKKFQMKENFNFSDNEKSGSKISIYILAVMSASKQIDFKELKTLTNLKRMSFAKKEEVMELTGCLNGAVPPFGSLFGVKTIVDESLIEQGEDINFNAGLRTHSVNMKLEDYLRIEEPILERFCK